MSILIILFKLLNFVIFLWCVASWFPNLKETKIYNILNSFIEPILEPIRKVIPPINGTIDISPMILIIGLQIIMKLLF